MALLAAITRLTINCSADSRIGGLEQLRLRRIRSIFQHTRVITLLPSVSLSRSSRRWRRCFAAAAGNCVSRVYHQYRFDTGLVASTHNIHTQPAPGWECACMCLGVAGGQVASPKRTMTTKRSAHVTNQSALQRNGAEAPFYCFRAPLFFARREDFSLTSFHNSFLVPYNLRVGSRFRERKCVR